VNTKNLTCDVLVIGSGGAGIRAAIAAYETNQNLDIILATRGKLGKSGVTATACSDRMAFHATLKHTEPGGKNNWHHHAKDIYDIGGRVSSYALAKILAQNSADAYEYLDSLGVPFVKHNGKPHQFITDGSEYPRACYTGPYTANHIEAALVKKVKRTGVKVIEDCFIADLIVENNIIRGAWCIDEKTGELMGFNTSRIILATGGPGGVFGVNVYPDGMNGDGHGMALRAGAELVNMEFIQIGLCSIKTKLACSGSMMRAVPRIVDDRGVEFLHKYLSTDMLFNTVFRKGASWPLSYEDEAKLVDIAVYRQIQKGRKVFLEYSHNPRGFRFDLLDKKWQLRYESEVKHRGSVTTEERDRSPLSRLREINPESVEWFRRRGIDLVKGDKIEIAPAIQHFQGGVKIDIHGRTTVNGLYACGECAGGQHGANRPGGNALLDTQVFGKIAGTHAAVSMRKVKTITSKSVSSNIEQFVQKFSNAYLSSRGVPADKVIKQVRELMSSTASVVRVKDDVIAGIAGLNKVMTAKIGNKTVKPGMIGFVSTVESVNILQTAQAVLNGIKTRNESRGPHLMFASPGDNIPVKRSKKYDNKWVILRRVV